MENKINGQQNKCDVLKHNSYKSKIKKMDNKINVNVLKHNSYNSDH